MSDRIVFRVLPNRTEAAPSFAAPIDAKPWKVTRASWAARNLPDGPTPGRPLATFRFRFQAVLFARRQALDVFNAGGRSQVVIHKRDGRIATEWTYRDDPARSKG